MSKTIQALSKGLYVISLLSQEKTLSLAQLHSKTNIPKATLLRILKTLQEEQWVHRSLVEESYQLSYSLRSLADNIAGHDLIAQTASPFLDDLQDTLMWPSDIAVRKGLSMEIVESSRRKAPFIINRKMFGTHLSFLQSAVGRVYLAFCSEIEREELLQRLRQNNDPDSKLAKDTDYIQNLLPQIQQKGYATREPGYWAPSQTAKPKTNVSAIAVPIMLQNRIKGCINTLWPEGAVDNEIVENHYYPLLKATAENIGSALERKNIH